jgi:hypothetical protein
MNCWSISDFFLVVATKDVGDPTKGFMTLQDFLKTPVWFDIGKQLCMPCMILSSLLSIDITMTITILLDFMSNVGNKIFHVMDAYVNDHEDDFNFMKSNVVQRCCKTSD